MIELQDKPEIQEPQYTEGTSEDDEPVEQGE